ncbi:hypothetical protein G6L37_03810 [Agrobacterium rubi]|nr:hypothetical protein [Agrobacterium rubi]NTF24475.1 hypothetical protein [Agrobacterium rubi]
MRDLPEAGSAYGASMGRSDSTHDTDFPVVFEIERLEWVNGDYDQGGAYWGNTKDEYIYRAEGDSEDGLETMFIRAKSIIEAKKAVSERYQNASFDASSDVEIVASAYLEAALWSTHNEREDDDFENESENLLGSKYDPSDELRFHCRTVCEEFLDKARELLDQAEKEHGFSLDLAGYNFWMTQSGSGVSFSDRDLGDIGDKLSKIARSFSHDDLYIGDDDFIHSSNQYRSAPVVPASL